MWRIAKAVRRCNAYQPPLLVNPDSGYGTGQLPDKDAQMYHLELDKMYLSPTAEVQLTNLYRDDILNKEELPIKMVAYAQCFRREAGSSITGEMEAVFCEIIRLVGTIVMIV